jgi:putative PIN family toxin of toxin-antitoxin system
VKLVVDINVLVSGTLWQGNPSRLLDALLEGAAMLCASGAVLAEFEQVLQRERFHKRLAHRGRSPQEIVSRFRAASLIVEGPTIPVPAALRDPEDVHILACALGAGADGIVTGDHDLLAMGTFEGIPVLNVRQALEKLGISAG